MVHIIKGYFCGGINKYLNLITCDDRIFIPPILKKYVLHWYCTYILHPGMDRTEAMFFYNFYWPGIRNSVRKEVTNCDTFQHKKLSNIKYVKLPDKESE